MIHTRLFDFIRRTYDRFHEAQLVKMSTDFHGLPLLALLGLLCGLLAGTVIILFRLFMEAAAGQILPAGNVEGFEELPRALRFALCIAGGLLVGLILHAVKPKTRSLGVVHVLERLDYHQGNLPLKNAVLQFIAAGISIVSGHSVGREGPSVHLGASSGSLLGRMLHVPNNSVRLLVGSGVAAAIAAAFNTPLAGVIFAMEVVIMEYTVIGFTPVIIAAVSATTLTRVVFGDDSAFTVPVFEMSSVYEIPLVALMGAVIGCVAALFIQLTMFASSVLISRDIWVRTTLAGVITGFIALLLPQVMGTGYDTVNHLLLAQIGLAGVLLLTVAKLLSTAAAIGLGIPAGIIGPTLFIGAAAGGAFGWIGNAVDAEMASPGFYAMLGMAAMMAATLQAPLAALISLLELTDNQAIILPGMIAVVIAALVTRVVFGKSSIYRHLMLARGLDYRNTPMSRALRRVGVASVMERDLVQPAQSISLRAAAQLLQQEPRWILLKDVTEDHRPSILPAADLASFLSRDSERLEEEDLLDLMRIPAMRQDISSVSIIATLQEAHERMLAENCQVLYVTGAHGATKNKVFGIVTREHIDNSYKL
ncbi:MAG: chloride channel protein [Arenicella sp.]|nr:chloride channel protein [Arenicella sp.]